ncbi:MAG: argininosuccinate lyase, partial [Firmicutes bacterium]|nr:argininosuccinate lyase [Bacillota bacterium]
MNQNELVYLHDNFFWIGQINKASAIINSEEGLIDKSQAEKFARGIEQVLEEGAKRGGERPELVIAFEPLLIKAAGDEITMLHAGRSSQDMLFTCSIAMMREDILALADSLNSVSGTLVKLAEQHRETIVPSYTNGVAAQATSYGHYLLAYAAGFERDMQRLQQYYVRLNRSPMGTTVLNGSSWPLNRDRMSAYLGFDDIAYNAYDATQIFSSEIGTEAGYIVTSISLHIGSFIEDVMQQYAQPRPWILLKEGGDNTYVSSAMPQKRNPGILNSTRSDASTIIGDAMGATVRAHNIPPGMADSRTTELNRMVKNSTRVVNNFNKILNAINVNPERAKEELYLDWTASQELADVLMREYNIPFRVGHHFASEIVGCSRANNLPPLIFPYSEVQRIYKETVIGHHNISNEFPMSETKFRATLDPVAIVNNRATKGGPQPVEMSRMISETQKRLSADSKWSSDKKA